MRIVTKKNSTTNLRMRGTNKKGSAYWFARLKDKELELDFEQDLMRRYGDVAAAKSAGHENVRYPLIHSQIIYTKHYRITGTNRTTRHI